MGAQRCKGDDGPLSIIKKEKKRPPSTPSLFALVPLDNSKISPGNARSRTLWVAGNAGCRERQQDEQRKHGQTLPLMIAGGDSRLSRSTSL